MATTARGRSSLLYFREQSAFGTAETMGQTAKFVQMPFYTFSPQATRDLNVSELMDGGGALPGDLITGLEAANFTADIPIGSSSLGYWLKTMFGDPTSVDNTTHQQHSFRAKAAPTAYFATIQQYHPDISKGFRLKDAAMTEFRVDSRKGSQRARMSISGISTDQTNNNTEADTAPITFAADTVPVSFRGRVQKDGVDLSAAVVGINFTCRSGVTLDQELMNGVATAGDYLPGIWEVEGDITLRLQDETWWALADDETLVSLKATFWNSTDDRVTFTMDDCLLQKAGPAITTMGPITSAFHFRAGKPSSSSLYPMEVQLKNQLASYPRA